MASLLMENLTVSPIHNSELSWRRNRKLEVSWDDATWILTSSFIIFTMQSGFGLLESGMVSTKNEVNIMVKNCVDVLFGGMVFWAVGFGLAFGDGPYNNAFCGVGYFFLDVNDMEMGVVFSWFIFQMSFATTSTTIASGAMAERTKLISYIVFSTFNILIYCFPAHWIWDRQGFLRELGVIDIAGAGAVHLVGGCSALVATLILKPRAGIFPKIGQSKMGCPTNCLVGLFMLWWGWLGFNCGSTFGISSGKWKLAARSAVATLCASMAGGAVSCMWSWCMNKKKFLIPDLIFGVLGSLVSVTGICALARPWESLVIGAVGSLLALTTPRLLTRMKIDDPVGVFAVHGVGGIWAMLSVGLFAQKDDIQNLTFGNSGVFAGGGFRLLGVQTLGVVVIIAWSVICSFCLLKAIDRAMGLRVSLEDEMLGADWVEHGLIPTSPEEDQLPFNSGRLFHRRHSLGLRRYSGLPAEPRTQSLRTVQSAKAKRRKSHAGVTFSDEPDIEINVDSDSPGNVPHPGGVANRGFDSSSLCDSGVSSDEDKIQNATRPKRRRRLRRPTNHADQT